MNLKKIANTKKHVNERFSHIFERQYFSSLGSYQRDDKEPTCQTLQVGRYDTPSLT